MRGYPYVSQFNTEAQEVSGSVELHATVLRNQRGLLPRGGRLMYRWEHDGLVELFGPFDTDEAVLREWEPVVDFFCGDLTRAELAIAEGIVPTVLGTGSPSSATEEAAVGGMAEFPKVKPHVALTLDVDEAIALAAFVRYQAERGAEVAPALKKAHDKLTKVIRAHDPSWEQSTEPLVVSRWYQAAEKRGVA